MTDSILIEKIGRVGRISLNDEDNRHAITSHLCRELKEVLIRWEDAADVELILIDHKDGTKGFCVGIDYAEMSFLGKQAFFHARDNLQECYQLVHLIARYPKPIITFIDGYVSGMGIGLAKASKFQVATENTSLAYPETGYGFVPDAGATRFLSMLPNEIGTWLALTGARLNGRDAHAVGLSSHFCSSSGLRGLKNDLSKFGLQAINDHNPNSTFSANQILPEMKELFSGNCTREIRRRLGAGGQWANAQSTKYRAKSPLATKIALRQMRTGPVLNSIEDALRIEYRIGSLLLRSREFHEGVRAGITDKDYCPKWRPSSLAAVHFDMVSQYFSPSRNGELELKTKRLKV